MEEKILIQILHEVKNISDYISKKAEKEKLIDDLNGYGIDSTTAEACKKIGNDSV
jgi:hypothetical protein